jgi:hypothetical protein
LWGEGIIAHYIIRPPVMVQKILRGLMSDAALSLRYHNLKHLFVQDQRGHYRKVPNRKILVSKKGKGHKE